MPFLRSCDSDCYTRSHHRDVTLSENLTPVRGTEPERYFWPPKE
jgi:hypothetical protein